MKILAINTDWGANEYRKETGEYGGVGYYRLHKPAQYLPHQVDIQGAFFHKRVEEELEKIPETVETIERTLRAYNNIISEYDLVISKPIDNEMAVRFLIGSCKYTQTPLIFDIDDNYFEILPTQPTKEYFVGSKKRQILSAGLSMADGLFFSTEPLKDYYLEHLKGVHGAEIPGYVLPNCNDANDWPSKRKKKRDNIVIGWAGSITHDQDLLLVMPALNRLLTKYPNLYLEFIGGVTHESAPHVFDAIDADHLDRIQIRGGTLSWKGYPELMRDLEWDIAIAPLLECEFNRGKSHIKWMEYSMKKIPTVASYVYPYHAEIQGTPTIVHGETGFLVTEGWDDILSTLIEDKKTRDRVGKAAYEAVKKNWQYQDHIHKWEEALCDFQ